MNTPSPLDAAITDAARKLLTLRMTRISGAGDLTDARNLNDDLDALCKIIDPVIEAIGNYAAEKLGVLPKVVTDHFTDVLRDALEGGATFHIHEAGKQATEYLIGHELVDA